MNSRQFVLSTTARLAAGEIICTALMVGVFVLAGYYDTSVLLGGIVGAVMAVANFFLMAVIADSAADKALDNDIKGGKMIVKHSFNMRLFAMAALLIVFSKSGLCNPVAMIIPLVLTRIIIAVIEYFRKSGEAN